MHMRAFAKSPSPAFFHTVHLLARLNHHGGHRLGSMTLVSRRQPATLAGSAHSRWQPQARPNLAVAQCGITWDARRR
tara:strand:- start:258 stop:488 length:231 start_codon:yes stop_codon:yes gene_type:complete